MAECVIAKATADDIALVTANIRPEHAREMGEASGLDAAVGVRLSVQNSRLVLAGRVEGEALFLVGVSKTLALSDIGSVWMVATPDIDRFPLEAAVALRELFSRAHELAGARVLEQWVPGWYRKGIKWLLWLGWKARGTRVIRGVAHAHMVHEETVK